MVVSYRQQSFYHTINVNLFKVGPVDGKAQKKKQETLVIKGAFHNADAQCLKKVQTGKWMDYTKLYSTVEKLPPTEWSNFFHRNFPTRVAFRSR